MCVQNMSSLSCLFSPPSILFLLKPLRRGEFVFSAGAASSPSHAASGWMLTRVWPPPPSPARKAFHFFHWGSYFCCRPVLMLSGFLFILEGSFFSSAKMLLKGVGKLESGIR